MIKFKFFKIAVIYSATLSIFVFPGTDTFAEQVQISDLRSQGWSEIHRREEIKKFPGERPYENLPRIVQIVHFVFEKDGIKKYCWISYDSQRDRMDENCK